MREKHYAISCIGLKISYVFKSQDKHNAFYFLKNILDQRLPIRRQKYKKIDILTIL